MTTRPTISLLRHQGYAIQTPFDLSVVTAGQRATLHCTRMLRILPGKRLVADAVWRTNQRVIAKILLDPRKSKRHYRKALMGYNTLAAARIPTPELVYHGKLAEGQAHLLLFDYKASHLDLDQWLALGNLTADRLIRLRPVVSLIAELHAAGLWQRDMHPGNFLISDDSTFVIDSDDIRSGFIKPLGKAKSLNNLALFFAQFNSADDPSMTPLLQEYLALRGYSFDERLRRRFLRGVRKWRIWRRERLVRKIKRSCTQVVVRHTRHRYVACDRSWLTAERAAMVDTPDRYLKKGLLLKDGNSATVASVSVGNEQLVIKRYNIKTKWHALKRCLRPTRAMVAWQNAHALCALGIATAKPLAVIEERWFVFRKRAYLISSFLPGRSLAEVFDEMTAGSIRGDDLIDQLEGLLRQLTVAQASHGDFKATNFIFSNHRLHLIDLDGMRFHIQHSRFRRAFAKDLMRLKRNWEEHQPIKGRMDALVKRLGT